MAGYLVCVYAGNDELASAAARQKLDELRENKNKVITRNPAFYGGEVEKVGASNARPDLVIIQKGCQNAERIAEAYEQAGCEVEFADITADRPQGVIEPSPTGELAAALKGHLTASEAKKGSKDKGQQPGA